MFEFAEYLWKNKKINMKNHSKLEKFRKHIENFAFFNVYFYFPTIFIFCPEIVGVERYNLYLSNINKTNLFILKFNPYPHSI